MAIIYVNMNRKGYRSFIVRMFIDKKKMCTLYSLVVLEFDIFNIKKELLVILFVTWVNIHSFFIILT